MGDMSRLRCNSLGLVLAAVLLPGLLPRAEAQEDTSSHIAAALRGAEEAGELDALAAIRYFRFRNHTLLMGIQLAPRSGGRGWTIQTHYYQAGGELFLARATYDLDWRGRLVSLSTTFENAGGQMTLEARVEGSRLTVELRDPPTPNAENDRPWTADAMPWEVCILLLPHLADRLPADALPFHMFKLDGLEVDPRAGSLQAAEDGLWLEHNEERWFSRVEGGRITGVELNGMAALRPVGDAAARVFIAQVTDDLRAARGQPPADEEPGPAPEDRDPEDSDPQDSTEPDEEAAIRALRGIGTAQALFRARDEDNDGSYDFAPDLYALEEAGLLDESLVDGTAHGYRFALRRSEVHPERTWMAVARPIGDTGLHFAIDQSTIVYRSRRAIELNGEGRMPDHARPEGR
jgi:hypothetical protein